MAASNVSGGYGAPRESWFSCGTWRSADRQSSGNKRSNIYRSRSSGKKKRRQQRGSGGTGRTRSAGTQSGRGTAKDCGTVIPTNNMFRRSKSYEHPHLFIYFCRNRPAGRWIDIFYAKGTCCFVVSPRLFVGHLDGFGMNRMTPNLHCFSCVYGKWATLPRQNCLFSSTVSSGLFDWRGDTAKNEGGKLTSLKNV